MEMSHRDTRPLNAEKMQKKTERKSRMPNSKRKKGRKYGVVQRSPAQLRKSLA
jgi:hypothetical protein